MHHPIDRRTLLKASGVSLALPLLESMNPVFGAAANQPPKRLVFVCTTLGLHPPYLWPKAAGSDYETTKYLDVLKDHRDDFTLFSGLSHANQTGRQPHDSEMTWLTAAEKPGMGGFRNSISIDQVAASQLGYVTRFPSITLGTANARSQSFTSGGVMIPAETSPANLFAKMFLKGKPEEVRAERQKLNDGASILDQLNSHTSKIRKRSSAADNRLLDEYFDSIRQAEVNIGEVQAWADKPKPTTDASQPTDVPNPADIIKRYQLALDMIPLIVQSDSSRVVSVMLQDHFIVPAGIPGVTGNHHLLSHHGLDESKIDQLEKIEMRILRAFNGFIDQMKSKTESGGRLLDHTTLLFGSNLGNANAHSAVNLPIFLFGGGLNHGSYVAHDEHQNTPLSNLFLTMLNNVGLQTDTFGQSTGTLSW